MSMSFIFYGRSTRASLKRALKLVPKKVLKSDKYAVSIEPLEVADIIDDDDLEELR